MLEMTIFNKNKREKGKINIIIPMAGSGSRFLQARYNEPKPFININGKTMIERVLDNLKYKNANYILVVRKEHIEGDYKSLCKQMKKKYNVKFIIVDKITEGTVCSLLYARKLINNNTPLMIAYSDQIVDINIEDFINDFLEKNLDGSLLTFIDEEKSTKWSFVKIDKNNNVIEVKAKELISDRAVVGIYLYKKGKMFVDGAIDMIARNDRVTYRNSNEFYVCPAYNYIMKYHNKIGFYDIKFKQMHGTGTPEDLNKYLEFLKNNNLC